MTTSSDGRDFVNRRRHAEKALRIEKMKRLVEEQQREEAEGASKPNGGMDSNKNGDDMPDAVPDINDKRCAGSRLWSLPCLDHSSVDSLLACLSVYVP